MSSSVGRQVNLAEGYRPGAIGRFLELQEIYYLDDWGFDVEFVRWTVAELAGFLDRYDEAVDRIFLAMTDDDPAPDGRTVLGSIVIAGDRDDESRAQVRWFIVDPEARGLGLGRRLFEAAMSFCEGARFEQVYLTTIEGLDAAIHLYEDYGFELVEEHSHDGWGREIVLLRYEVAL